MISLPSTSTPPSWVIYGDVVDLDHAGDSFDAHRVAYASLEPPSPTSQLSTLCDLLDALRSHRYVKESVIETKV